MIIWNTLHFDILIFFSNSKKVCIMHLISNRYLALNAFKLCKIPSVQKYENQIVLGAVFILEEKCVPLKKWFITKSTFYVSTMGWNLFWRSIFTFVPLKKIVACICHWLIVTLLWILWKILITYCKFIMAKVLKWGILHICTLIIYQDIFLKTNTSYNLFKWDRRCMKLRKKEIHHFQPIVSCNTCTEQPLFIPCYLSSKYKYLYKKTCVMVVCYT